MRWIQAGRPPQEDFAASATPAPVGDLVCDVHGCAFPAVAASRLCDAHGHTYKRLRDKERGLDVDGFLAGVAAAERRLIPHYDFSALAEPLRSELRYAIQQRLDESRHALDYRRVLGAAACLDGLGVGSRLDGDQGWWAARLQEPGRSMRGARLGIGEVAFVRYARVRLARLRDHAYRVDPFAGDVWLIEQLGFSEYAYQPSKTISFAGIEPRWFRELVKRWARWRLRAGTYTPGTVSGMASEFKLFSDFVAASQHRLDGPGCLTREVLEDYREHVGALGHPAQASAQRDQRR